MRRPGWRSIAEAGRSRLRRAPAFLRPCSTWAISLSLHLLVLLLAANVLILGLPPEEDVVVVLRLRRPAELPRTPAPEPVERDEGRKAAAPEPIDPSPAPAPPTLPPATPGPAAARTFAAAPRPALSDVLEGLSGLPAGDVGVPSAGVFGSRDAAARREAASRYGGTDASEDAVNLGLGWLAAHQREDGRWSSGRTPRCPPDDLCSAVRRKSDDVDAALTGLALLAFLGAGHTTTRGAHAGSVAAGFRWMLKRQQKTGHFTDPEHGNMYIHGICSYALAEACALGGDEKLRKALSGAVAASVRSQIPSGGWEYDPTPEARGGEMTLSVWQMMALRCAEEAGMDVPAGAMDRARQFLRRMTAPDGLVRYYPGSEATMGSAGAGLFARSMLGMAEEGAVRRGLEALREMSRAEFPGSELSVSRTPLYAWYYRTLAEFQEQGRGWREWNRALRPYLVSTQLLRGHAAGSWSITDRPEFGTVYSTSLCLLMLEVYYRYPPRESGRTVADVIQAAVDAGSDDPSPGEVRRMESRRPPDPGTLAERRAREREEAVARLESDKPEDRYLGARKLAELEDAGAIQAMIRAAGRETGNLKALHVGYIGRVRSPEAIPFLVRLLDDPDEAVRKAAVSALVRTTGKSILEASRWKEWFASQGGASSRP